MYNILLRRLASCDRQELTYDFLQFVWSALADAVDDAVSIKYYKLACFGDPFVARNPDRTAGRGRGSTGAPSRRGAACLQGAAAHGGLVRRVA